MSNTKLKTVPKTPFKNFIKTGKTLRGDIIHFMQEKEKELGDIFQIDLGFIQLYGTSNPDAIKHVLQKNQKNYQKSRAYEALKMGLGNGLVTSAGDYWRKQRRLSQPAFYKTNLENLFKNMSEVTAVYLKKLEQKRATNVDIAKEMTDITATIVLKALFNVENNNYHDEIYESMDTMQGYIMRYARSPLSSFKLHLNGSHKKFMKKMETFDNMIYDIINNRRNSGESKADLLQMLMDVEDADTGEKMTDLQLRDELITLFSAGHETSANALAWTWYLLAQHPDIMQKLKAEVNQVLPNRTMPTFAQLRQLQYTKQVIEEGMRLYPPAWVVGRRAIEDDEVNGYAIKKGRNFLCEIYLMHRSPKWWKNPTKFNPNRFSPEQVKARPSHYYLPFGAGPRMCIGNHFAMMEMQLLLATIAQRFDFDIVDKKPIELDALITLRPKNGILLTVK